MKEPPKNIGPKILRTKHMNVCRVHTYFTTIIVEIDGYLFMYANNFFLENMYDNSSYELDYRTSSVLINQIIGSQ